MPALSVSIDGVTVATTCTDGYEVVSVRAGGTRIDEDFATLALSGGSYPENGESIYLLWINDLCLRAGQVVTVSFLENASTSHPGKTIEELFPDVPPITQTDFKPTTEMYKELRSKPKLREKYSFRLVTSSGASFIGETTPEEYGFGFTVLWNSHQPERARIALHSYTLGNLEARDPLNYHFEERIYYDSSVQFELVA